MAGTGIRSVVGLEPLAPESARTKLKLLGHWRETRPDLREMPLVAPIDIELAGIHIRLHLRGAAVRSSYAALNTYYQPFLCHPPGRPELEIYLLHKPLDPARIRHSIWNEPSCFWTAVPQPDQSNFIVHRDFAACVSADESTVWAMGPQFRNDWPDTIDNLISITLANHMLRHGGLILHASCVEMDGGAYVFFGKSGAGKSTLAEHCWRTDGLRVLSGDQIFLRLVEGRLVAQSSGCTIPEFPRGHKGWCTEPRPVRGLFHLIRRNRFVYQSLQQTEILPQLLRETFLHAPGLRRGQQLLNLWTRILQQDNLVLGEFSYPKGVSFLSYLRENSRRERAYD